MLDRVKELQLERLTILLIKEFPNVTDWNNKKFEEVKSNLIEKNKLKENEVDKIISKFKYQNKLYSRFMEVNNKKNLAVINKIFLELKERPEEAHYSSWNNLFNWINSCPVYVAKDEYSLEYVKRMFIILTVLELWDKEFENNNT